MPPRNAAAVPTAQGSSTCPSVSPATVSVASTQLGLALDRAERTGVVARI